MRPQFEIGVTNVTNVGKQFMLIDIFKQVFGLNPLQARQKELKRKDDE
jgi:hypothetical protein